MLCKFFSFEFKTLASLHLAPKAIMTLVLISSLSCPAMGMEKDPTDTSGRILLAQQAGPATTIETLTEENGGEKKTGSLSEEGVLSLISGEFAQHRDDQEPTSSILTLPPHTIQSPNFEKLSEDLYKKLFSFIGEFSDLVHCTQTCMYWHTLLHEVVQNKLFLIGPGGRGKSTLVHLLTGKPLVAKKGRFSTTEKIPNVDIRHGPSIGTLQPTCVLDFSHKRLIIDCPPFNDPRGPDQDFVNALALHRLLKGKVSVVLVVSESDICDSGGWNIVLLINKLTEIFPDQSQLQNILSLVVSKQGHCWPRESLSHIPNLEVKKFAEKAARCMMKRGRDLLQFLVVNPSHLAGFHFPKQDGPYPMPENLKVSMQNWEYVVNPQVSVPLKKSVTSRQALWSLNGYYNQDGTVSKY